MAALLGPAQYAAANASLRARVARFLPPERWQELLTASTLNQVVRSLGSAAYRQVLEAAIGRSVEPEQVEQALWTYLVKNFRTPLKFVQGQPRQLLDWLWRRFEVDNLKTVLRTAAGNIPADRVQSAVTPLGSASDLPWKRLIEAASVPGIVENLRSSFHGQFYARALDQALDQYRREGRVFVLEVTLDLAYYRRLLRLVDGLSGRDRREAERFVGTMVDGQNLLWAFRYRTYFDLSPEEILTYTLHRKLRVDAAVVREIAIGAAWQDIVTRLWGDRLPGLERLVALPAVEALPQLELAFRRYLYHMAREALQGYPFHLGTILAYEVLLESEVRDLITIVEGKAAGWQTTRIQPYLIGSRG